MSVPEFMKSWEKTESGSLNILNRISRNVNKFLDLPILSPGVILCSWQKKGHFLIFWIIGDADESILGWNHCENCAGDDIPLPASRIVVEIIGTPKCPGLAYSMEIKDCPDRRYKATLVHEGMRGSTIRHYEHFSRVTIQVSLSRNDNFRTAAELVVALAKVMPVYLNIKGKKDGNGFNLEDVPTKGQSVH